MCTVQVLSESLTAYTAQAVLELREELLPLTHGCLCALSGWLSDSSVHPGGVRVFFNMPPIFLNSL